MKGDERMFKRMKRFFVEEEGISSVEYAILLAFVVLAVITAVTNLRTQVVNAFTRATNCLTPGGTCT
jgi:pilus assembly protein Flp/PilA